MNSKRPDGRTDGGFLLLEVLVAFVIAALALSVLLEGTIGGLRATSLANRYNQAVARARSHLAAIGRRASPLVAGVQGGDDGSGFHWQTDITPLSAEAVPGPPRREIVLYRVTVTESWSGDRHKRSVQLTSARLATEAAPIGP